MKHLNTVRNNASKQHTVGYSQSQQVFKVYSLSLHKDSQSESFCPPSIATIAHSAHTSAAVAMGTAGGS